MNKHRTISIFEPEEILPLIRGNYRDTVRIELFGMSVRINSLKLYCFKKKGLNCFDCGMEGKSFYLIEDNNGIYSLQLCGIGENSKRVFMTIDHIVPISKEGKKKSMLNVQPMCEVCNCKKGNKLND